MTKEQRIEAAEKRIYELIYLLNSWEKDESRLFNVTDGSKRVRYYALHRGTKPLEERKVKK
jgi:hypothetical protein